MKRPGPWLWLRYAYGAALPERYREWVLHDVTAPTWVVRHVLRGVVQFLPFAVVLMLVIPVDKGILATGIAMGALIGLLFSTAFVDNVAESRAMKAGYPEGYATRVRRERVRRGPVEPSRRCRRAAGRGPLRGIRGRSRTARDGGGRARSPAARRCPPAAARAPRR